MSTSDNYTELYKHEQSNINNCKAGEGTPLQNDNLCKYWKVIYLFLLLHS